jgi:hypothetical protein
METAIQKNVLTVKKFILISLLVSVWVNASEVFRYFVIVRPQMKSYLSMVPDVSDMNLKIFSIWGLWDTILTMLVVFLYYLYAEKYGRKTTSILKAGTICWAFFFLLFWVGMPNMGLANWSFVIIPLSLAWIETIVACFITNWLFAKFDA